MPLSINVGLSREASKDYQSTGVSINVTAELDQSLLARPDELQQEVANLYAQAEQALDRQSGRPATQAPQAPRRGYGNSRSTSSRTGSENGTRTAGRSNGNGGEMTESQRKAILAIARRADVDPAYEAREMLGADLGDLSLRQASELIDTSGVSPRQATVAERAAVTVSVHCHSRLYRRDVDIRIAAPIVAAGKTLTGKHPRQPTSRPSTAPPFHSVSASRFFPAFRQLAR